MSVQGVQEPGYAELIAELAAFRTERLQNQPSDRALAQAAGVSPTTVGNWLGKGQFPQEIGQLLVVVRAVRTQAERAGIVSGPAAAAVLDEHTWRRVFEAEATRRADGTRAAVHAGQGRAALERMRPGRPLPEVADPFHLEVHHAISSPVAGLPALPAYVPREHDHQLAEVVEQAAAGASRIAVLVGGSSTGKTRACWEALELLRAREEPWRLWHPIDPTRPEAALAELSRVAPYTVIWLNEAQEYLLPERGGQEIAAGLRTLLRDPQRTPVLVLATLWPSHWDTLTTRTETDPHAQARELLVGHRIKVPDAFTDAALDELAQAAAADPRLAEAAEQALDGQITQYLAGVPVLLSRFEDAPPATKALICAAMDARRLGAGPHIPLAWLAEAAPGYLTEAEWNQSSDDWLEQALHYVTTPCSGIQGILTPVKTGTPRNQRNRRRSTTDAAIEQPTRAGHGPLYRLADYLEQHGRHHRADVIPPIDFWTAAVDHAHAADLTALGNAARACGLYRDAAQLHKIATTNGNPDAATSLINHFSSLHPTDLRPAQCAAEHVSFDDPQAVAVLLNTMRETGAGNQVDALLARDPAAHVPLDEAYAIAALLHELREAGAEEQVGILAARTAKHATLDHPHPEAVALLLRSLREVGADDHVSILAKRAVAHVALDDPEAVAVLLEAMQTAAAVEQINVLLAHDPAIHANLHQLRMVARLLHALRKVGAEEQVDILATRIATDTAFSERRGVARLLRALHTVGAEAQVDVYAARAVAELALDDPRMVAMLLDTLPEVGASKQMGALLARNPATYATPTQADPVITLLRGLHRVGAQEQVAALAARAARQVALNRVNAAARLLHVLRDVGAEDQASVLAARAVRHAQFDEPRVAAGTGEQDAVPARPLPTAKSVALFTRVNDRPDHFRFGREPDGSAAAPWTWEDLE